MAQLYAFTGRVVVQVINPLILLLAAGAFVLFIWGVFRFIQQAGNETAREDGKKAMLWGIIGLVIIFGAYGIINVTLNVFNIAPIQKISQ